MTRISDARSRSGGGRSALASRVDSRSSTSITDDPRELRRVAHGAGAHQADGALGERRRDYAKHIRKLLDMGVPISGIGVQGNLHGDDFDPVALQSALDEPAKFNLPIRVTELNFPGQRSQYYGNRDAQLTPAEEQAKAEALKHCFRISFAHPAVTGILMWRFWEGANGIPQSSLSGAIGRPHLPRLRTRTSS